MVKRGDKRFYVIRKKGNTVMINAVDDRGSLDPTREKPSDPGTCRANDPAARKSTHR
tara:strand:- start:742 stop:912 length:171 start_codon:yes stop_codon:yes gene_type:complete